MAAPPIIWDPDIHEQALRWRGIDRRYGGKPCGKCHGSGVVKYQHGSTWRGGMASAGGKFDICSDCWGSGNYEKPWLNLRDLQDKIGMIGEKRDEQEAT